MVTNLRVHHGPLVANIVEDHHEGVLHAACGPGVMTTTLRANAQELQVSTTIEENARDAPACGSRAASSQPTIASALEKLQPALFLESGIDRGATRPSAHRVLGLSSSPSPLAVYAVF